MARPPIERINEHCAAFRDDDRAGWKMVLVRGADGDFHISVVPDYRDMVDEDEREIYKACFSGSIRVRMPMIGGGDHEALYKTLAALWKDVGRSPLEALEPANVG